MAYEFYAEAYRLTKGYYSGINAATLALMRGERDGAYQLAREVRVLCQDKLQQLVRGDRERYWVEAALGKQPSS